MLLGYIFFFLSDYCVISSVYLGILVSLQKGTQESGLSSTDGLLFCTFRHNS